MRLHSDIITLADIQDAAAQMQKMGLDGAENIRVNVTEHKSRSRKRGFEVVLEGNGTTAGYQTKTVRTATWDEYGIFIARLYQIDWQAMWNSEKAPNHYADGGDFQYATGYRFGDGSSAPEDMHLKHRWDWGGGGASCRKCSAGLIPNTRR